MLRLPLFLLLGFGLLQVSASAAVFTVGPDGDYAQFGNAVSAALAAGPGRHELRLQQGEHALGSTLAIPLSTGLDLVISGGWDADFERRETSPEGSTLRGDGSQRLLDISGSAGRLSMEGITLRNGSDPLRAGLLLAELSGGAALQLSQMLFRNGLARGAGGCAVVTASGVAAVTLEQVGFEKCIADDRGVGTPPAFQAAALWLELSGEANADLQSVQVLDNLRIRSLPGPSGNGAALTLLADDQAQVQVQDLQIQDNELEDQTGGGLSAAQAVGLYVAPLTSNGSPQLRLQGLEVSGNRCDCATPALPQMLLALAPGWDLELSNALIQDGGKGILLPIESDGRLRLAQLTLSGHSDTALMISALGPSTPDARLDNSILFGNGTDLVTSGLGGGWLSTQANFIGQDPGFLDAANGNFRLQETGPAADTGLRELSVDSADLDGLPRDYGSNVDPGAYESRPWPLEIIHRGRFE